MMYHSLCPFNISDHLRKKDSSQVETIVMEMCGLLHGSSSDRIVLA